MKKGMMSPEEGIVWITGASSGIGRALALRLAGSGYRVAVTARSHDALYDLQREAAGATGSIIVLEGDVTSADDMTRVLASIEYDHGPLSLCVLNAGIYVPVRGHDLHLRDFERTFAVNLTGVVNCLVPAISAMKTRGRGQIAIVSSVTGYGGLPTSAAYGATKAALINMAESLKFDLDRMNIKLQVINPGFVETAATAKNKFHMPALQTAGAAAEAIHEGLRSDSFEITFPKRFTWPLKLLKFLPYSLYFPIVRRVTRW
ncbi:SDR family NAD(P)-dependent oxidoreductase [Gellertiella hungarica]|uniref:NAD(P)-dependent dehydrogenase (Short-subunit alcohol dehydrogenase family) n=1 Tax=Gellertiella hungarica TaxID=1572859 RepID=A0A7W6J6R0_9HYPH|nr:SDR family NAD(P)-dependent oxidoreductase [Gellertiella hungarica]MBB4065012.1 NAD(P)-dependent dehydrogenase (short-subunit alcohol dehydrogenase family) [Gellertiella hungarica]